MILYGVLCKNEVGSVTLRIFVGTIAKAALDWNPQRSRRHEGRKSLGADWSSTKQGKPKKNGLVMRISSAIYCPLNVTFL